jgi:hypothetical protein
MERYNRLNAQDNYEEFDTLDKPHPTTKQGKHQGKPLYIENENLEPCSLLREDDLEVYFRIIAYRNQLFRMSMKLNLHIKWLPYTDRY